MWKASSSIASGCTPATRPRQRSVAARWTFGSRTPVAAVDADLQAAPTTERPATRTSDGSAARSRPVMSPGASSSRSRALTAIRETAWMTTRAISPTVTVVSARGSARRAGRTATATCRGSETAMERRLSLSQVPLWASHP
ncbi:hypothetical protein [Streptomyces sp. bgisy095]|uniref:hypothetical protein n=1 Tax=unclassified Streptomyces TaxID=2593676 RepID=UPI003D71D69E